MSQVFQDCDVCGGEGRIWMSRYGGNDPDVWDAGPCEYCGWNGCIAMMCEHIGCKDAATVDGLAKFGEEWVDDRWLCDHHAAEWADYVADEIADLAKLDAIVALAEANFLPKGTQQ